jgi:predicted negative regulator of RcsB-dependent stress response
MSRLVSALLLLAACSRPAAKPAPDPQPSELRFIEDDYARARSEAQSRNVPLFVDVWASWCHTCLSMRSYVFPDPALRELAGSFVWLAIDSERAGNAEFLQRFPTRNLPTLWVIEPKSQRALLKWIGAATPQELSDVLGDVGASPDTAGASALWVQGDRASANGSAEEAVGLYEKALASGGPGWSKRARAIEALSMRLMELGRAQDNFELALREQGSLRASTSLVNLLINGIDSAAELNAQSVGAGLGSLLQRGTALAQDRSAPVLVDDRSSLYLSLIEAQKRRDPAESKRLAGSLVALLEAEAARAPDATARRVWDPHRVEAYLALGEPARALPMLQQSAIEVPNDYNPPARLARVQLALGDLPAARAAIDRALPLSDGPRKLRLYGLKADILIAAGERAEARAALQAALDFAREAKLSPQYDKLRQSLERRVQELS